MATQTLEFDAGTGLTISCKLFALESDTVVATVAATEKTNDKGRFSVAFTDVPAGAYRLNGFVGAVGGFVNEIFDLTLTTDVFHPRSELGNLPSAENISDRLEREDGPLDTALGSISPLTGPFAINATVVNNVDSVPIEKALVRIYKSGSSESKYTAADGTITPFAVIAADWVLAVSADGFVSKTFDLTVTQDFFQSVRLVPDDGGVYSSAGWIG